MLENIKNEVYIQLEMLFAEAAIHELTNDMSSYQKSIEKIVSISDILGIKTDIIKIHINLRKLEDTKEE